MDSISLSSTRECIFTYINDNISFTKEIPNNEYIGNICDIIRPQIRNPFDLVYKEHGKDGPCINKNHIIYANEFYIRLLSRNECNICFHTGLIITQSCNHNNICTNCYNRISSCPYCRREYNR